MPRVNRTKIEGQDVRNILNHRTNKQLGELAIKIVNATQYDVRRKTNKRPLVHLVQTLPGEGTFNFLCRFSSAKTRERILEPTRADDRLSYIDAQARGDVWAMRKWQLTMPVRLVIVTIIDPLSHAMALWRGVMQAGKSQAKVCSTKDEGDSGTSGE
jgi:hypothetical protein